MKNTNDKTLLFSLSKDQGDFVVEPVKRSSGKGGQKANKTASGCRVYHPASGAQVLCYEERSFNVNKERAFRRLVEGKVFQTWLKLETSKKLGQMKDIDQRVDDALRSSRIEVRGEDGRWREATESDFKE